MSDLIDRALNSLFRVREFRHPAVYTDPETGITTPVEVVFSQPETDIALAGADVRAGERLAEVRYSQLPNPKKRGTLKIVGEGTYTVLDVRDDMDRRIAVLDLG